LLYYNDTSVNINHVFGDVNKYIVCNEIETSVTNVNFKYDFNMLNILYVNCCSLCSWYPIIIPPDFTLLFVFYIFHMKFITRQFDFIHMVCFCFNETYNVMLFNQIFKFWIIYTSYSSPDAFGQIETEYMQLITNNKNIVLVGDFNARTAEVKNEHYSSNNQQHLHFDMLNYLFDLYPVDCS
jgi:hypothetical protein